MLLIKKTIDITRTVTAKTEEGRIYKNTEYKIRGFVLDFVDDDNEYICHRFSCDSPAACYCTDGWYDDRGEEIVLIILSDIFGTDVDVEADYEYSEPTTLKGITLVPNDPDESVTFEGEIIYQSIPVDAI